MKIGLVINFVSSLNVILWYEKHTHTQLEYDYVAIGGKSTITTNETKRKI